MCLCFLFKGEKQRLSFLRLLYHEPEYALLDEFTSSVDQTTEQLMYERLQRSGCSYMSIAHRDTVRRFHTLEIRFKNENTTTNNNNNNINSVNSNGISYEIVQIPEITTIECWSILIF